MKNQPAGPAMLSLPTQELRT